METRYDSAGRVQPVQYGNMAHPGICLLCNRIGKKPDEIFASLGVELEYYGVAYLCLECCAELADFIRYKSPDAFFALKLKHEALKLENEVLKDQLAEAKGLLNARIDSAGRRSAVGDGASSVHVSETESEPGFVDRVLNSDKSVASKSG